MSSDTIEKAGGRVGIVGTGHRARVCPLSLPFLPSSHSLSFLHHLSRHDPI
jgi:hypothetical protein